MPGTGHRQHGGDGRAHRAPERGVHGGVRHAGKQTPPPPHPAHRPPCPKRRPLSRLCFRPRRSAAPALAAPALFAAHAGTLPGDCMRARPAHCRSGVCVRAQGYVHRAEGSPSKFNLLDQLFMDQPSTRAEMEAVTSANNMFSLVMAIRSPLLREWLGIGERDVWHQVQVCLGGGWGGARGCKGANSQPALQPKLRHAPPLKAGGGAGGGHQISPAAAKRARAAALERCARCPAAAARRSPARATP